MGTAYRSMLWKTFSGLFIAWRIRANGRPGGWLGPLHSSESRIAPRRASESRKFPIGRANGRVALSPERQEHRVEQRAAHKVSGLRYAGLKASHVSIYK